MLFVTVGTYRGDSLVKMMDQTAKNLDEEVIIQLGRGNYIPRHCRFFRFAPSLQPYFRTARLIVGHGGVGTTFELLNMGAAYVAVSSLEIPDAHQQELLAKLERENLLVWCKNLSDLPRIIRQMDCAALRRYRKPECRIGECISDLLNPPA